MKHIIRRELSRTLGQGRPDTHAIDEPALLRRDRHSLPLTTVLSFLAAALSVIVMGVANYQSHMQRLQVADAIAHAGAVSAELQEALVALKDAETGQRGYLLTDNAAYLQPYLNAQVELPGHIQKLRELLAKSPEQLSRLNQMATLVDEKMAELEQTVALQRGGNAGQALSLVQTDRGKLVMDQLRQGLQRIDTTERDQARIDRAQWSEIVNRTLIVNLIGAVLLLILISTSALSAGAEHRRRAREAWIRRSQLALANQLQGDPRIEQLGESALSTIAQLLDAHVGAFHLALPNGQFQRIAGYALPSELATRAVVEPGEGLVGQAAKGRSLMHVQDLPEGYLQITSSTGSSQPRELLLVPAVVGNRVQAVLELGFFRQVDEADIELIGGLVENLAMSVRAARDRTRLEELLEETRRQAEELQTQQEELRVSNEELEEQSRTLKESQSQLQNQQAELEQNNLQLEQHASELSAQRDQLASTKLALAERAEKLERASQYKSEFLANMSHELRTPLNSTLILAKLLGDNKDGNLTAEQVKYAQTISSAGNDLLNLINDILDLAKIEAGKVEIDMQPVSLPHLLKGLQQTFEPLAIERGLVLRLDPLGPDVPAMIVTDEQRTNQILKNLLSNALKFTSRGEVSLRVAADTERRRLHVVVQDSGIGIAADKLDAIFDAFVQEDGSTHRKYGGTGLGLSLIHI